MCVSQFVVKFHQFYYFFFIFEMAKSSVGNTIPKGFKVLEICRYEAVDHYNISAPILKWRRGPWSKTFGKEGELYCDWDKP